MIGDLKDITDANMPYTRRSFSALFLEGREYLKDKFKSIGLNTFIDPNGNLMGFKKGKINKTIMIGSHSDTVPGGGIYDGIAGVCAAFVIAKELKNTQLNHNLIIVDYLAEEASEWGPSCIGSMQLSDSFNPNKLKLKHPTTGESLGDAIKRMGGYKMTHFNELNLGELTASFELHIEQGGVLESNGLDVGIVSAIVGISRIKITFMGEANHAGTTPLNLRDDAFLKACEYCLWARERALHFLKNNINDHFVITSSKVDLFPNASNVICGRCEVILDFRSDNDDTLRYFEDILSSKAIELGAHAELISMGKTSKMDEHLIKIMQYNATKLNIDYKLMPSGAGHDSAYISKIAPSVMIFSSSVNGISHNKNEFTSRESFKKLIDILYSSILTKDKDDT